MYFIDLIKVKIFSRKINNLIRRNCAYSDVYYRVYDENTSINVELKKSKFIYFHIFSERWKVILYYIPLKNKWEVYNKNDLTLDESSVPRSVKKATIDIICKIRKNILNKVKL